MASRQDTIWFVPFDTQDLCSPYDPHPAASPIAAAEPFTVSLRTIMVAEPPQSPLHRLIRSSRDVLVLSSAALGDKPPLQRVHYFAENLPLKTVVNDFIADVMYVVEDYSGRDHLWLELQIVDVGTDPHERETLLSKFDALATSAGSVFPVTLPYTLIATTLATMVDKFMSGVTRNKPVLRCPISLSPPGRHGTPLLRPGNYVLFPADVDGSQYQLESNERLITQSMAPVEATYAVFTVDSVNAPSPEWVNSQRVATLLTQLDHGNPNTEQASIEFVTDTLTLYSNFCSLQRYQQLKQKPPETLTPAEIALMHNTEQRPELQPFLPTGKQSAW